MSVDSLSQKELLTLLSILEGELEARDLVIESLRAEEVSEDNLTPSRAYAIDRSGEGMQAINQALAQRRDAFVQERYGKYNLSDPFLALQRDGEVMRGRSPAGQVSPAPPAAPPAIPPSPLAVLKLVMSHCKRMQEKMLAQLAAAESRHRKVIVDLEEEKRRHAQDTAEGDDVTCMLEKERERLLQKLGFESSQAKRMQKEQRRLRAQLEESRAQHKQLASSLAKESQRGAELGRRLEEEHAAAEALREELEAERRQALRAEARAEEQLAEFDTEKEQLRAWLRREEERGQELQAEVERLRSALARLGGEGGAEDEEEEEATGAPHQLNGHSGDREAEPCQENGCDSGAQNPAPMPCPALGSSPGSSPLLARHPVGVSPSDPSYQASYQAGIHQRFHAARHKFQGQPEQDQQGGATPRSPRDLSPNPAAPPAPLTPPTPSSPLTPPTSSAPPEPASLKQQPTLSTPPTPSPPPEPASVKQLARNTVTQALSRFTGQQGGAKPAAPGSPPSAVAPSAPAPTRVTSPVSPGVKSPIIPRAERGHPPPIPPKKPGLAQTPMSPGPAPRASHFHDLSSTCGLTSSQEASKEPDLVLSSTS